MTRRRILFLAIALVAVIALLVIAILRARVERRHGLPRAEKAAEETARGELPPPAKWTDAFRTAAGDDLAGLVEEIEAKHPDLYRRWSLAWLHARALIEAGDDEAAVAKLAPFTVSGHPFRDLALHHRASVRGGAAGSADRLTLIFEHARSPWREEAIDEEIVWRASLEELQPLLEFAARIAPSASTARRREISSRVVEALIDRGRDQQALLRALSLLQGGTGDDAADRAARAIDRPAIVNGLNGEELALLGEALQTHRHYERAAAVLGMAIARQPGDDLRFALGRSYFGAERFAEAQAAYMRGANATRDPAMKAQFLWHAARAAQLQGDDAAAERLMTAAIAVKGTHPSTTAALTQRIRTRVRQRRLAAASADLAQLRRMAAGQRAVYEGSLAYAVGALGAGQPRACIVTLDAVPRAVLNAEDRAEIAYWRARSLERIDPAAAVRGYLDVHRISQTTPYRRFARQRLSAAHLHAALEKERTLRDAQAARLLAAGSFDVARRIQTERLHLSASDRATQLKKLQSIYGRLPGYRDVLELKPEPLPRFPLRDPAPLDLLLAMGLFDDAVEGIQKRWGLRPPAEALTRSWLLNLGGASRQSIYAIEVMMRSVPEGFQPELLPPLIRQLLHPRYFGTAIEADAARHDADPALVLSIMREESRFDPRAKSQAAARGLLQFIITTARDVGRRVGLVDIDPEDLYDPRVIISLGAKYIGELSERFGGNGYRVAASYNAGPKQAELWSRLQPAPGDDFFYAAVNFDETKGYVRKVMGSYEEYAGNTER